MDKFSCEICHLKFDICNVSGHSKWATIRHDKGVNDAKRGKLFSRLAKAISIAVREGGGDNPDFNPKLRLMVEKAKEANMPKENIKRAVDKGAGRIAGAMYEEVTYEGFGPNKVAFMVECVTDNRNRTNSEIKSLFDKNGGVLGSMGSTNYFFDRKGVIEIDIPQGKDMEELQLELIDFGAEDFQEGEDGRLQMLVPAPDTHTIAESIKNAGYEVTDTDVIMVPNTYIELSDKEYERFMQFYTLIDDYDDVQKVYHNAKAV